jgi:hypothetical protein
MKRQFSALGAFVLTLGALATQSCESTDGQNSYYNRAMTAITAMAVTLKNTVIITNAFTSMTTTSRITLRSTCVFRPDVVQ